MATKLALQELLNQVGEVITYKENTLKDLNHHSYTFFRKIILYEERNLKEESDDLEALKASIHNFYKIMNIRIPETIGKLNSDREISSESKANHKSMILSTKGVNELLGLIESIVVELTRSESYQTSANAKTEIKAWVESLKSLAEDTRAFISMLQKGVDELPPAALYTVEGHLIGVALIMVYSFTVAFNVSFLRLSQPAYEKKIGVNKEYDYYTDLFLPLLGIPGYILMHYISTRLTMKTSFMVSLILLVVGNAFYYIALDSKDYNFYLIGKGIIVSRLPMYGVKQYIGFNTPLVDRVKLSTCSVASMFLGYSLGYFMSLTSQDYSGNFITFTTTGENIGGLFIGSFWIIITCFCSVLFVNPEKNYRLKSGHDKLYIQFLTILSYTLPFIVMQTFVSNHARPIFVHEWNELKFFTFLAVFCLMAVPVHMFVYISSYFTTDRTLIVASKLMMIIGGLLLLVERFQKNSQEFWYVTSCITIIIGVNIGIAVSLPMLSGNIRNHRVGLFAGILEVFGIVFGNYLVMERGDDIIYFQIGVFALVLLTFIIDILKFNEFNFLNSQTVEEPSKKNN